MLYTRKHLTDFLRWQGHDPEKILQRIRAHGSTVHDWEAWSIVREWYDAHARLCTKEMLAELLDMPPAKTMTGLTRGRLYLIEG